VPILAGRDFTAIDTRPVALINETFARKYLAGRNPIGLHIGLVDDSTNCILSSITEHSFQGIIPSR
jgi:hypothetical protein